MVANLSKPSQRELLQAFADLTKIRLNVVDNTAPLNFYDWVDTVKQNVQLCELNNENAIVALRGTLIGACSTNFYSYLSAYRKVHSKEPSLEEVFKHFESQYANPLTHQTTVQKLLERCDDNEDIAKIASDFHKHRETLMNMTAEEWITQAFIHRLPPLLAVHTLQKKPMSLDDAISIASIKQRVRVFKSNHNQPTKNESRINKNGKRSGIIRCSHCHKLGHTEAKCYKKKLRSSNEVKTATAFFKPYRKPKN